MYLTVFFLIGIVIKMVLCYYFHPYTEFFKLNKGNFMSVLRRVEGTFSPMLDEVREFAGKIVANPEIDTVAFSALGVHPRDVQGQAIMKKIITEVLQPDVEFHPAEDNPGVYFISKKTQEVADAVLKQGKTKPIAVFKVGVSKRAHIELAAREIACILGLDYLVSGVFFGFENLPRHAEWGENFIEELWNGNTKIYLETPSVNNYAHFGILEPYIEEKSSLESEDQFGMLLFTALAIGLRDGKEENITSKIIDAEECMPNRLDPRFTQGSLDILQQSPSTHLPFLFEHRNLLDTPISDSCIKKMKDIVNQWDVEQIVLEIANKKILFMDEASENHIGKKKKLDGGNCLFKVEAPDSTDVENSLYPTIKSGESIQCIFNEEQIAAFRERLERLKTFIGQSSAFTPRNLIQQVDPFYVFAIEQSLGGRFSDQDVFCSTGRVSVDRISNNCGRLSVGSISSVYLEGVDRGSTDSTAVYLEGVDRGSTDSTAVEVKQLRKRVQELEEQLARLQAISPKKRTESLPGSTLYTQYPANPAGSSSHSKCSPPRIKPVAVRASLRSEAGDKKAPELSKDSNNSVKGSSILLSSFCVQPTDDDVVDLEGSAACINVIKPSGVFTKYCKQKPSSLSSESSSSESSSSESSSSESSSSDSE